MSGSLINMALITKESLIRLGFESGLIVFSVMLALFLDQYRVTLKNNAEIEQALSNVRQEIISNIAVLEKWHRNHKQIVENINNVMALEKIPIEDFIDNEEVHFFSVFPDGVVQELLEDSAWMAFKSSEVFSNLDFETMMSLSKTYKLQQLGVQQTLQTILMQVSSREFIDPTLIRDNLVLLRRYFTEIKSQEEYLILVINKCLNIWMRPTY